MESEQPGAPEKRQGSWLGLVALVSGIAFGAYASQSLAAGRYAAELEGWKQRFAESEEARGLELQGAGALERELHLEAAEALIPVLGRRIDARRHLEAALEGAPDSARVLRVAELYARLAALSGFDEDWSRARALILEIVKKEGASAATELARFRAGEAEALEALAARADDEPAAAWALGVKAQERGLWDEALQKFEKACRAAEPLPEAFFSRAQVSEKLGIWEGAARDYQRSMVLGHRRAEAGARRAWSIWKSGDRARGLESAALACAESPGERVPRVLLAALLRLDGRLAEADAVMAGLRKSAPLKPGESLISGLILFDRACLNLRADFFRRALGELEAGMLQGTQDIEVFLALLRCYRETARWEDFQRALPLALALNPQDPRVIWERGRYRQHQSEKILALEDLEAAWKLASEPPQDWLWELAKARLEAGEQELAIAALKKVLVESKNPKHIRQAASLLENLGAMGQ